MSQSLSSQAGSIADFNSDPTIFDLAMQRIFGAAWVYSKGFSAVPISIN